MDDITPQKKIVDACQQLGFKVREVDDNAVIICYQMHIINICHNKKSPDDCTVIAAVEKEVLDRERLLVLERCNELNERLKYYKYYISGSGVVASIEFCFSNEDELKFQLEHAVRSVSLAKSFYERNN